MVSDPSFLIYLKKRAAMTKDIGDEKVQSALGKIRPPKITVSNVLDLQVSGFDVTVSNKMMRWWIDLVPEYDRSFMRFIYTDGDDDDVLKYLKSAMSKSAWNEFYSLISKDQTDEDMILMRHILWNYMVLGCPIGLDFKNFEMNQILSVLPIDIACVKNSIVAPSLAGFYKMIYYAKWVLENVS